MRKMLMILSLLIFLVLPITVYASIKNEVRVNSNTDGGDATVKVNINNQVNTGSTENSSTSETKVKIHQSGEGTANVKINDKEYNLEGPGELNINENTSVDSSSDQTPSLISTSNLITVSPIPSVTPSVMGILTSVISGKLQLGWESAIVWLQGLMSRLWDLF